MVDRDASGMNRLRKFLRSGLSRKGGHLRLGRIGSA
jgi:hypothetical protein